MLRAFQPADQPSILACYHAAAAADGTEPLMTAADLHAMLTHPSADPAADFFVAEVDGQPIGFAGLTVVPGARQAHRIFVRGVVHPAHRRRGLGRALWQAAEARARQRQAALPGGLPVYLDNVCRSVLAANLALVQAQGLAPVRRFRHMRCDLRAPLPDVPVPEGFTLRAWQPADDAALLEAHNDAFHDHWGDEPVSPEQWQHYRAVPHFRPEQWLLAWTAGTSPILAGFTLGWISPDHEARVGRREALIDEVGVRSAFQRRGLASALIARSLRALRAAGLDGVVLVVDTDNAHAAPQLYQRLGFALSSENIVFRKQL